MRFSTILPILIGSLPTSIMACYQVHGTIGQFTDKCTLTTYYLPSIYFVKDNVQICDGHFGTGDVSGGTPYNADFTPGGVPSNTTFSGPWSGANSTLPYANVEIFGINGQALIRDYESAFWINPEDLSWEQEATSENLAGNNCVVASYWTFDSGNVQC